MTTVADRPDAARRLAGRIRAMVTQLGALPERGRVVPEFGDAMLRECVVRPYRVITRLGDSQVEVLAVVHARRLVEGADE